MFEFHSIIPLVVSILQEAVLIYAKLISNISHLRRLYHSDISRKDGIHIYLKHLLYKLSAEMAFLRIKAFLKHSKTTLIADSSMATSHQDCIGYVSHTD